MGHSFSARYFSEKFEREGINAAYSKYPIEHIEEVEQLLRMPNLAGLNVTLPHKVSIIDYLDELDETAREIGAVNVVKKCKVQGAEGKVQGAKLVGYNTDAIGFMDSIRPLLRPEDKKALMLGTGGVSRAVRYGLSKLGVEVQPLSRHSVTPSPQKGKGDNAPANELFPITYDYLHEHPEMLNEYTVIVNGTPLGMTPNVETCPDIPYDKLGPQHLLFDCVYTPEETLFLRKGREQGCRTRNGMDMLYGQAIAAWKIWNNSRIINGNSR